MTLKQIVSNYYLQSFLLGAISCLCFAPFNLAIILLPCFAILFFHLHKETRVKKRFLLSFLFGLGHHLFSLYWLVFPLYIEIPYYSLSFLMCLAFATCLTLVYVVIPSLLTFSIHKNLYIRIILFPLFWITGEYIRTNYNNLFTFYSFPWNLIGYSWGADHKISQSVYWLSIYGLGYLNILAACILVLITKQKYRIFAVCIPMCLFLSLWFYGNSRIKNSKLSKIPGIKLRLVQSDISNNYSQSLETRIDAMHNNITLAKSARLNDITHIIFSESSVPFVLNNNINLLYYLADSLLDNKQKLITGAFSSENKKLFSTAFVIDAQANVLATYHKRYLVPFGEFIPMRNILTRFTPISGGDFSSGTRNDLISINNTPDFNISICYDILQPNFVVDQDNKPQWLLNITNDNWFRKEIKILAKTLYLSTQPYQHLDMTRFRAIENKISIIRVTNGGFTANIDPYGRIIDNIELGQQAIMDTEIYTANDQ